MTADETPILGLTRAEVAAMRQQGKINRVPLATSRPLLDILRGNFITVFNGILAGAVGLLLFVGEYTDAFLVGSLVLFSVLVSTIQEIRAKVRLDYIALLTRAHARVIRDGVEQSIDPGQVVLGDYLVLAPGEQVVADGVVVRSAGLEVDESPVSGEAEPVPKSVDDPVLSGSYCLAGTGIYRATRVGAASYVHLLTAAARRFRAVRTPLQRFLDRVLWLLLAVVLLLLAVQILVSFDRRATFPEVVSAIAVIATLVPQGLLLMSTVAYSLGALRVAQRGGLVQELNAVESLSHVDVLCADKTGTLTRGRLALKEVVPLGARVEEAEDALATFAASVPEKSSTVRAIVAWRPAPAMQPRVTIPFRAERRWSAISLSRNAALVTYVLGAPEALLPYLGDAQQIADAVERQVEAGRYVLLFAQAPSLEHIRAQDGTPRLRAPLEPLAIVCFEEELRTDARETLEKFARQGVTLKIISGDHPKTVLTLAHRVGLPTTAQAISGAELQALPERALATAVERNTVFGRISPHQKQQIIRALKQNGHYVAMIGDGVNDILALKEAQMSIAVQSGTPAVRGISDLILLHDALRVLPAVLDEGRRVINNLLLLIKLFLTRDVATITLIVVALVLGLPFPFVPAHISIIALLTVGVPSLSIVAWAEPARLEIGASAQVFRFVLPVGAALGVAVSGAYVIALAADFPLSEARTIAVTAAVLGGLIVLVILQPGLGAQIPRLLEERTSFLQTIASLIAYLAVLAIPATRAFVELDVFSVAGWLIVLLTVGASFGSLRLLSRIGPPWLRS